MKAAALFALILFALPSASRADENLVAKREACRQEARVRIFPRGKFGIDEYRRTVERRNTYVSQCMGRTAVAQQDLPLPPKREIEVATDVERVSVIAPVRKKPQRVAKRAERRKIKVASIRKAKGKRLKGQRLKRVSRRYK